MTSRKHYEPARVREHGHNVIWTETPQERINAFRKIVQEKQFMTINGHTIDLFTACHVVQVCDALKEEIRNKFLALPMSKMIDIMWKTLR